MMNFTGLVTVFVLLLPITPTENELALVSDNLYFDKTEISNAQWERFEAELINKDKDLELYRKSDVWKVDAYNNTYFQKFKDYPVVGISKLGATEYCKWRNSESGSKGTYRLPTKNEFLSTIKKGEQSVKLFKKKMKFEKNNEPVYNLNYDLDRPHTPSPSESYFKNKFGVFNLIGNVSEIVVEDNIVVGGSWRDNDILNWENSTQEFSGPQDWIGFRCVCELK